MPTYYGQGVRITDTATPALKALSREMRRPEVRSVMARAGVNTVKSHLRNVDSTRGNRLGGRRTHFYAAAARATNFRLQGAGFVISINHVGIAQRYHGGKIRALGNGLLTIPAHRSSHGRRAREFPDIKPGFGRQKHTGRIGPRFLYLKTGPKQKTILYWLVKETKKQAGDSTVLPRMTDLADDMTEAAGSYLQREWNKAHG